MDDAVAHFDVVLAAFQLAAAVAIWRGNFPRRSVRVVASILIAANAVVVLANGLELAGLRGFRPLELAADYPTPILLLLLAAEACADPRARWLPAARVGAGALAGALFVAAGVLADAMPPIVQMVAEGALVFAAYALATLALAMVAARQAGWTHRWMLAAVLVRSGDFAVRYPEFSSWLDVFRWMVPVAVGAAIVMVMRSRRLARSSKLALVAIAALGAVFGLVGRVSPSPFGRFEESLITLTVGRPALLLVALTAPGTARPFFRAIFAGVAAYLALVLGMSAIDLGIPFALEALASLAVSAAVVGVVALQGHPARASPVPAAPSPTARAPELEDWERLIEMLARAPSGARATRREIAAALGILPRNVQRVVDAANRSPRAGPGRELVRASFERGARNQLEYRYELTPAGREAAPVIATMDVSAAA